MDTAEWTLTEVARLLNQPQHRLIYFCEKGVIIPDFSDAQGRGTSRRFSARNIFEFSIALVLSEFHFPAKISANFLYAVRKFEIGVISRGIKDFSLPHSLRDAQSPELIAIITNGSVLSFSLGFPEELKTVFGGVDISNKTDNSELPNIRLEARDEENKSESPIDHATHSNVATFEINLTKIAQHLELGR